MIVLAAAMALLLTGWSQAVASIQDQAHELTRYQTGSVIGQTHDGSYQSVAQTVRAGITGRLSKIDFWAYSLNRSTAESSDLIIDIRTTEPDGSPSEPDTSILGQVSLPWSDFVNQSDLPPYDDDQIDQILVSADLTSLNLNFSEGDMFAIHFSINPSQTEGGYGIRADYEPGPPDIGPYSDGAAYLRTNAPYTGPFVNEFYQWQYPHPISGEPAEESNDIGFRTFVTPIPEPSSILVWALLGSAVSLVIRRTGRA
jgi:hypothetical protein